MQTIEFEAELQGDALLPIPADIAARLPNHGTAKVILVLEAEDAEDTIWRQAAYEQFMREDDPEDAVYDSYL